MGAVVSLSNIHKQYGNHVAVDDLSMQVEAGQVYGFLGPNGAGKTTSIRILLGIIDQDSGQREIMGHSRAFDVARRIGYLPEERGLYKNMSAERVIAYLGRLKGMDGKAAINRARILLDRYGLGDAAKKKVKQLSKGMAQKVQVLSTFVHDPDLLVLDEPFSGLDPVNQQILEQLLSDMREEGKTIIFSTHVMQHAERLCDRIGLIARGRDVFSGTVREAKRLLTPHIHLRTAQDITPLKQLSVISDVTEVNREDTMIEWRFEADKSLTVERLVELCAKNGIGIDHFAMIEPSLHEVFVHLVGQDTRQETGAEREALS